MNNLVSKSDETERSMPVISGVESRGSRRLRRRPDYSRYLAMDVKSPLFSDPRRLEELVRFYADVFNDVPAVESKWSQITAHNLLRDRLDRPGSLLVLMDTEDRDRVMGAFFARIVPGREGMELTEPDVLIGRNYRGRKLGNEMGYLGRRYGDNLCYKVTGEHLLSNVSQTYRDPSFPKDMWVKHGYRLEDLFVQSARELLVRSSPSPRPPKAVTIRVVENDEINHLAQFMANPETTTSDGGAWTPHRAKVFLEYMCKHNRAIIRVAENGTGIVGLLAGDTIPRRTGSGLVNLQGFISSRRKDGQQIVECLVDEVVKAANTVSLSQTNLPVTDIEIPQDSANFFNKILPNLRLDRTYIGMRGSHDSITNHMRPRGPKNIAFAGGASRDVA